MGGIAGLPVLSAKETTSKGSVD